MAQNIRIKGDWMKNGYLAGHDTLHLTIASDGTLTETYVPPLMEETLRCEQWGNDCPVITNGCWTFAPDNGELDRVGIVPRQMIAA